ncbi:DUF4304 domain-containing protein [Winogradskyella endarachnes]|uniref:DUF4304 domain-containing protein n=1 Tax=Winogradskyella endarachnes TaxID=2681965 RepID=A0A6L6UC85_9FLAO|nr:DUF4304 domain-containing protein [Winogradskyella endarachnes]MUU79868.1 DUF4304 domain-containing protein [Winogradskyella endarachnes]
MKPRELITTNIVEYLSDPLSEIGFKFLKSSLSFKRKKGDFEQKINFQLNRYNQENVNAEFWALLGVESRTYSKWFEKEYGIKPVNNSLAGVSCWNIPNWKQVIINNQEQLHFELINEKERNNVMTTLKENILNIGIPYLNDLSNWERSANRIIEKELGGRHSVACDFFLIENNKEKALWALEKGLEYWTKYPQASFSNDKKEISLRLKKHFNK